MYDHLLSFHVLAILNTILHETIKAMLTHGLKLDWVNKKGR